MLENNKRLKPKSVGSIIIDSSSDITGAFRSALYTAKVLGDSTEEAVLFVVPKKSHVISVLEKEGFEYVEINLRAIRKNLKDIFFYIPSLLVDALKVKRVISEKSCGRLIVNDYNNLVGASLKLMGWRGELYTFVRRIPSSQPKLLSRTWINLAMAFSKKVICVSDAVRKELPNGERAVRLYNAIDLSERISKAFPDFNAIEFCCLSNFMPDKGQMDVLEAFKVVCDRGHNVRLRFHGGTLGLDKNKRFKSELIRRIASYGLSDRVEVLGFCSDIEKAMKEAHVVVNCGYAESFSRVCVEAGWFGRPVIATRCGGPEEIIVDGVTGLLVNVADPDSIANAMLRFISCPQKINGMGQSARARVEKEYSLSSFSQNLKAIMGLRS